MVWECSFSWGGRGVPGDGRSRRRPLPSPRRCQLVGQLRFEESAQVVDPVSGVGGPATEASTRASPTANAIWVSSVTRAGSPFGASGPSGGKRARISRTFMNSTGAPSASPRARPNRQPDARFITVTMPSPSPAQLSAVGGTEARRSCLRVELAPSHHKCRSCAKLKRDS